MPKKTSQESKESFIGQEDRPEVRLDPDMPISQLRVRDLTAIIGSRILKPYIKEIIKEKPEIKEIKIEKHEKFEKLEAEPQQKYFREPPFDPGSPFEGPHPEPWRQLVEVVTGLSQKVDQLADQVAELQQKMQR